MKRLFVALLLTSCLAIGCNQANGDVCQIDDDCESGSCNAGTGRCQEAGTLPPAPDARPIPDAGPDAMVDAAPDAMVDANPPL